MRIGIDIDNTTVKTEILASKLYKKLYKKDFFKLGKIDQYIFCGNHPELLVETEFFPNFKKVIKKLNEKHEIYFITARSDKNVTNIEKATIKLLEDNNMFTPTVDAPRIVEPERDVPGISDSTWKHPILRAVG